MFKAFFNKYLLSSILLSTIVISNFFAFQKSYIRELNQAKAQGDQQRLSEILPIGVEQDNLDVVGWFLANTEISERSLQTIFYQSILMGAINHNKPRISQLVHDRVPQEIKESVINRPLPLGTERKTALHYAAEFGHDDIVEQLLAHNANTNAQDRDGLTPLHSAAIQYKYGTVLLLLKHGANPNAQDSNGNTPLHYAYNKFIIATKLLQHGADKNIKNNDDQTYIDLKRAHREQKQRELDADPMTAILRALWEEECKKMADASNKSDKQGGL